MTLYFLAGYVLLIAAYHCALLVMVKLGWLETSQVRLFKLRMAWVEQIRSKNAILAVQTLRNWNMSATFLASASLLIASGLLSVVFNNHFDESIHISALSVVSYKLFVVALTFIIAFLNFSLCLRAFNHAGYLCEVSATPDYSDERIAKMLRRIMGSGARHYTYGMRCIYLSMPLVLWIFGDLWLFCGLGALFLFLVYVDFLSA